jgi:hypothetical protein
VQGATERGAVGRYSMDEDRVSEAAERLTEREAAGATLDDILSGEVGRRWIAEACDSNQELAAAAFRRVHPAAYYFAKGG